ncbi:M48 family peptidase, partial [Micrococcus sp. ACRRV]|nr:M48 family peptidase [Micrococcus sp. ACRRV]
MSPSRTVTDLDWHGTPVRLVRSARRTRTVAAVWREGRLQVSVPARLSRAEERRWIERMVDRSGAEPSPVDGAEADGAGCA